ncbi:MAG: hypothetical protein JW791_00560 [Nanoarchaeota archaeon]|nr:hypothetical protein [Nanoarchaeota archaeon]
MAKKKHSTNFYLIMAFFVSAVIFASGIGIGLFIDNLKGESISASLSDMRLSLQDAEIELLVMDYLGGSLSCDYLTMKSTELGEQSTNLGTQLDVFEQSNQINPDFYVPLKQEYTRVLIKNWITLEEIKKSCNSNYSTILYFYNNIDCQLCDNQAYVLEYFKSLLGDKVLIFALDAGLNAGVVDLLRYNFNVEEYPSLVINGELYSGYQDTNVLTQILNVS